MSGSAPLFVPATPRPRLRDERIAATTPWFARQGPIAAAGAPALLTFSVDGFVDAFLEGVAASGDAFRADAWVRRNAFKDYAEPPRAMKDATAAPRYDTAAVRRAPATPDTVDNPDQPLAAEPVTAAQTAEWARDPDASRRPSPLPWLRKLYLPIHGDYTVVSAELLCDRFGWVPVGAARPLEVGLVVRRLVRGVKTGEVWEDWVQGAEGRGAWVRLANPDMTVDGGALVDPGQLQLPTALDEATLRARIGLPAPKPLTLAVQRLAPIPGATGTSDRHSGWWGLLSVLTADTEGAGPPEPPRAGAGLTDKDRLRAATAELAVLGKATIAREVADHAATLASQIANHTSALRDALLPTTAVDPASILATEADRSGYSFTFGTNTFTTFGTHAQRLALLNAYVDDLVARVRITLWDTAATDWKVTTPTPKQTWWNAAYGAAHAAAVGAAGGWSTLQGAWNWWILQHANLKDVVLARVRGELATSGDPRQVWSPAAANTALLWAVLCRRLRALRLEVLHVVHTAELPAYDPRNLGRTFLDGTPMATLTTPGAEISAWLDALTEPIGPLPPLKPVAMGPIAEHVAAHRAAGELERVLFDAERACIPAGGAFAELVTAAVRAATTSIDGRLPGAAPFGRTRLRFAGIDVAEQPLRGLLAFPTWKPDFVVGTGTVASAFADAVAAKWTSLGPAASDPQPAPFDHQDLRKTLKARHQTPLPRFDSDSIYAVWVYARVANHDPCRPPILAWSGRTEPFTVAEPMDLLGLKPVNIRLPDLQGMVRDLPRISKAGALPFAAVTSGPGCGLAIGEEPADTARDCGIAMVCSFGIPVFTLCAWILFSIIFNILLVIPGFAWMLLLKFCLPIPRALAPEPP